ncbi:MAG: S8 family peptidase [Candidatus Heimdallarchaeaceae archaeon]
MAKNTDEFRIIAKLTDSSILPVLERFGKELHIFNSYEGIAITLTKEKLFLFLKENYFLEIWNNAEIFAFQSPTLNQIGFSRSLINYTEKTQVSVLWNDGIFGNDTVVAILDTGMKLDHPALQTNLEGENRVIASKNFIDQEKGVADDNGHGSEVAGIIGSNGLFGFAPGIAPNCKFLIGKVLDYDTVGTIDTLIEGIDWAIENNADVINLSLGRYVTSKYSPEVQAVNNAVEQGVIVCTASGNARNTKNLGYNDYFTMLSPGIATKAITIGAVDSNGVLYEHSSAGPVAVNYNLSQASFVSGSYDLSDAWLKPDILAPGVLLNTTSSIFPFTKVVSGTSYSTAVVTGICALIKQYFPDSFPSQVKAAMLESADSLFLEYYSPTGNFFNYTYPKEMQGAGEINVLKTFEKILDLPSITFWPKQVPFFNWNFFRNERTSFLVHIFVNKVITNITLSVSKTLRPSVKFSEIPLHPSISQIDVEIFLTTENLFIGYYSGFLKIDDGETEYQLSLRIRILNAKGRILIDARGDMGTDKFYSPYGNLYPLISRSRELGLIPTIFPNNNLSFTYDKVNLNDYEIISLVNYNSSSSRILTEKEQNVLIDYLSPKGKYHGGTILVFPSHESNLQEINSILISHNISYSTTAMDNMTINLISENHFLARDPYTIGKIYIPHPFNVSKLDDAFNSVQNLLVYSDNRNINGSLVIACNNIDMFLLTPYLYLSSLADYSEEALTLKFGENRELLDNILSAATVSKLTFNFTLSSKELPMKKNSFIKIYAENKYKPLTNWKFYLTLEAQNNIFVEYTNYKDYRNGTYLFSFSPSSLNIPAGEYTLSIRSASGTYSWQIHVLASISLGPILVTFSLVVCVVYLVSMRKEKLRTK